VKLTSRFSDALLLAAELHADQVRKVSCTPYLAHLLAVAAIVLEHDGTEDEAIAALLHDAVEDQGGAAVLERILRRFGPEVAGIVEGCSDTDVAPKPPWRPRKESHIARLRHAGRSTLRVVAADRLHNVRSLVAALRLGDAGFWDHFRGGREGTLWYCREVLDLLKQSDASPLVGELDLAVCELERLAGPGLAQHGHVASSGPP